MVNHDIFWNDMAQYYPLDFNLIWLLSYKKIYITRHLMIFGQAEILLIKINFGTVSW